MSKGCFWVTGYINRSIYKNILSVTVLWLKAIEHPRLLVLWILILNISNKYMKLIYSPPGLDSSMFSTFKLGMEISFLGNIFSKSSELMGSLEWLNSLFLLKTSSSHLLCTEWYYLYNSKELRMTSLSLQKLSEAKLSGNKFIFINVVLLSWCINKIIFINVVFINEV